MDKAPHQLIVRGSDAEINARKELAALFRKSPIPEEQLMTNLSLYTRATLLAKTLYLNELYQLILNVPGVIVEFGSWWGANLALFSCLRSVYEPYNFGRRVIGFDMFEEGYSEPHSQDGQSEFIRQGSYATTNNYKEHLDAVLTAHQHDNVMPHIRKHELIKGNIVETAPRFFEDHPETVVALAYLDVQLYEPTKGALGAVMPHVVKGSVLAIDELNSPEFPGETVAVREMLDLRKHTIVRSHYLPDRTYVVISE